MISLLFIFLLMPDDKVNITIPQENYTCIRKELASQIPIEVPAFGYETIRDTIPWVLQDSLFFSQPLMNNDGFSITNYIDDLRYSKMPDTLSSYAQLAVLYAPLRFRNDLRAAFHRLDTLQDFYAGLILNTPLKYVDEVIFQICHIGPEILSYSGFEPDLLQRNVELLYEIDDSLEYANIVDYALAADDYYSTVQYRVVENYDTVWYEVPWDIYYQYIVHPIISDEFPDMSSYVYSKLWREYLFYDADDGYPTLSKEIQKARYVWDGERVILPPGRPFTESDCALDIVANWVTYTVPVAAQGNRPIQPNIIAHEHNGNCGELQDVLTAAARACLIPCICTMDPCEDHVWCEFYERGWYPYQVDLGFGVTHLADSGVAYDQQHGGSKRVSAIFNWRSDGLWWTVTNTYSNTCSLFVYVYDLMGRPVDGAGVTIASEGIYGGISTSTRAYTDPEGFCSFALGDLRNFYARVSSPIGTYPPASGEVIQIIENSQTGAKYYKAFYIDNYIPSLRFSDTTEDYTPIKKFEVIVEPLEGQSRGNCGTRFGPGDSIVVNRSFFEKYASGNLDIMLVNEANWAKYMQGQEFKVHDYAAVSQDTFAAITGWYDGYHLIISNEDVLYYTPFCNLKVNLYHNPITGIEEAKDEIVMKRGQTIYRGGLLLHLNEPSHVKIYEASGRLIYDSEKKVPVVNRSLACGIYFVSISTESGQYISKCVVVK